MCVNPKTLSHVLTSSSVLSSKPCAVLKGWHFRRTYALTSLDVREWLAKHAPVQPWLSEAPGAAPPIPGDTAQRGPARPKVHVELAGTDPEADEHRAREKASEEEKQRAQNTLPAWHLASTISGHTTGLGRGEGTKPSTDAPTGTPAVEETRAEDVDCASLLTRLCTVHCTGGKPGEQTRGRRNDRRWREQARSHRRDAARRRVRRRHGRHGGCHLALGSDSASIDLIGPRQIGHAYCTRGARPCCRSFIRLFSTLSRTWTAHSRHSACVHGRINVVGGWEIQIGQSSPSPEPVTSSSRDVSWPDSSAAVVIESPRKPYSSRSWNTCVPM